MDGTVVATNICRRIRMTVLALTTVARIYNIVEGGRCSGFEPVGPQEHDRFYGGCRVRD
jgi:hypothetical protein